MGTITSSNLLDFALYIQDPCSSTDSATARACCLWPARHRSPSALRTMASLGISKRSSFPEKRVQRGGKTPKRVSQACSAHSWFFSPLGVALRHPTYFRALTSNLATYEASTFLNFVFVERILRQPPPRLFDRVELRRQGHGRVGDMYATELTGIAAIELQRWGGDRTGVFAC